MLSSKMRPRPQPREAPKVDRFVPCWKRPHPRRLTNPPEHSKMEQVKKDSIQRLSQQQLYNIKVEMRRILSQVGASQHRRPGSHEKSSAYGIGRLSRDVKNRFNTLLENARAIESVLYPHPVTRMPDDIILEIFRAVVRTDPDTPLILSEVCTQWRALVLNTPGLWTNIHIMVNHKETLEALDVFFLFSGNLPLEITLMGVQPPRSLLDKLVSHGHRIRSLEIRLQKDAPEPFRVLRNEASGGLRALSRLAVGPPGSEGGEKMPEGRSIPTLETVRAKNNALDASDMSVIQLLPALHSLTALVLHDIGTTQAPPLELPCLESLTLVLENLPTLLQSLKCNSLLSLDIMLDNTSRDGWWDLLLSSLAYPELQCLSLDVTLDRSKDDWTVRWNSKSFERLPSHNRITELTAALSFAGKNHLESKVRAEYVCGDILDEFVACFSSLKVLQFVHVPFFYAPFMWPSPQILYGLRRLVLQVPAIVHDERQPVTELPNLRELKYYGNVDIDATQLPTLLTPFLEYLEIVHHLRAINPTAPPIDRHWPGHFRLPIYSSEYGVDQGNSSKNFPSLESLAEQKLLNRNLPVIHQSRLLQTLVLYIGYPCDDYFGLQPEFCDTEFPKLRVLHCPASALRWIRAPQLEELHLLWSFDHEWKNFTWHLEEKKGQSLVKRLKVLDIYSNIDPYFHEWPWDADLRLDEWLPYLDTLEVIFLPHSLSLLTSLLSSLMKDPHLCPNLTTIKSFQFPDEWSRLIDCIELRNHLAMENDSVKAIHTLVFPLAPHSNITECLIEVLSGRFSASLVAIPNQPWALKELIEGETIRWPRESICFGCIQSGNAFQCMKTAEVEDSVVEDWVLNCARHSKHIADGGAELTACATMLSRYLKAENLSVELG